MRTGVIAKKLGMTRLFETRDARAGDRAQPRWLSGHRPAHAGEGRLRRPPARDRGQESQEHLQAMRGHFAKGLVEPKRFLAEFRVSEDNLIDVGAEFTADHFLAGQKVDVSGLTVGKGFRRRHQALELRRHARHPRRLGLAPRPRLDRSAPGSGKVFKGKKMAGHMGQDNVTTLNLTVFKVDVERGLILIKGAVPGTEVVSSRFATR